MRRKGATAVSHHSGSARALGDKEAFDAFMQKAQKDAEAAQTDAQRTAAQEALQSLRADYLSAYRSLMNVRAGTYSGFVAGRAKLNAKQANAGNNALDKAMARFDTWVADNQDNVKQAIRKARSPEQIKRDRDAVATAANEKAAKVKKSHMDFLRKILAFKKGDKLRYGADEVIVGVSMGRDGYPSSISLRGIDGSAVFHDKRDIASMIRAKGESVPDSKRKMRELVDEIRAEASDGQTQAATKKSPANLQEDIAPAQDKAQTESQAPAEPSPLEHTPKQYADAWLRWSAEANGLPLAEVREMQGDEAGLKAIEQRWVDAVVQEAKSGQPTTSQDPGQAAGGAPEHPTARERYSGWLSAPRGMQGREGRGCCTQGQASGTIPY